MHHRTPTHNCTRMYYDYAYAWVWWCIRHAPRKIYCDDKFLSCVYVCHKNTLTHIIWMYLWSKFKKFNVRCAGRNFVSNISYKYVWHKTFYCSYLPRRITFNLLIRKEILFKSNKSIINLTFFLNLIENIFHLTKYGTKLIIGIKLNFFT